MKLTIHDIAELKTGLTTYDKAPLNGEAIYLNARLFDTTGRLTINPDQDLRDLRIDRRTQRCLLQPNDLLFAAKGEKNFATVYDPAIGPAVASATFIVLRLRPEYATQIFPPYLAWLLNHPTYRRTLKAQALGSTPPSISKKTLQQLTVRIPPMATQRTVLAIDRLQQQRNGLLQKIRTLKNQLTAAQLLAATEL